MFRKLFIFAVCCIVCVGTYAHVTVTAEIDSNTILIGEQAHITLKVTANSNQKIVFPTFPNKRLAPGIEVLKEQVTATEKLNDNLQTSITKVYTITSFDSSMYYIPPFNVKVAGQIYPSKNLALKVETMNVDTLHTDRFFGPKNIADVPFSWSDWSGIFYLSLLLLLLLVTFGYITVQLRNKKPLLKNLRIRPALPPHQWAINEIRKLNKETISENSKEYYTRLTDVLRSYIQRRYGFNAREMTSTEIIDKLMKDQDRKSIEDLQTLFQTADLAKFAKLRTLLNENDDNLLRAVDFINATKLEAIASAKAKPVVAPEIQRSRRSRLLLKTVNAVIIIGCLIILYFIGYNLYYLIY